jgi:hypothetical protein
MFIHIGGRTIVSDKTVIAIFNVATLRRSPLNERYLTDLPEEVKTIVIDSEDAVITSNVSPFTVIKRTGLDDKDLAWRKADAERV